MSRLTAAGHTCHLCPCIFSASGKQAASCETVSGLRTGSGQPFLFTERPRVCPSTFCRILRFECAHVATCCHIRSHLATLAHICSHESGSSIARPPLPRRPGGRGRRRRRRRWEGRRRAVAARRSSRRRAAAASAWRPGDRGAAPLRAAPRRRAAALPVYYMYAYIHIYIYIYIYRERERDIINCI